MIHVRNLFSGLIFVSPAILVGLLIARYIPSQVIGACSFAVLVLLIYVAGDFLRWPPWGKKR